MLNIILSGCMGKMGRVISEIVADSPDMRISCGIDKVVPSSSAYPVYSSFCDEVVGDVIIDFSRPELLDSLLDFACAKKMPIVIATTGLSDLQIARIDEASAVIPVFFTANMSLGVNLLSSLVKRAAAFLGDGYDIEIVEAHHNQKVDAPSGTALMLARSAAEGSPSEKEFQCARAGKNVPRRANEIGIHAVRGGTVVGEHSVLFLGNNEVIELKHSAQSKSVFAVGAVRAAQFIRSQSPGKYDMNDLLG